MIYQVYAIKDELQGFMQPTFEINEEVAVRNFAFAVNRKDTIINENVKHFTLYRIGTYDSELGVLTSKIELVVDATSIKRKVE